MGPTLISLPFSRKKDVNVLVLVKCLLTDALHTLPMVSPFRGFVYIDL